MLLLLLLLFSCWFLLNVPSMPPPPTHSTALPTSGNFLTALLNPNPTAGHPTHQSTSGGFPPQKANTYIHPEMPTGILLQPL